MPIEKIFTFVCFGLWVLFTLSVVTLSLFRPDLARLGGGRRLKASNAFDLCMLASIGSWLAMWCFRSMY